MHQGSWIAEAGASYDRVADIGCGPGWLTRHLAFRGLTPLGVDISSGMLRLARSNNPGLGFAAASLTQIPVATGSIAGVFCWYVLHHVPDEDLTPAIQELARVVVPGGAVMLGGHVGDSAYVKTEGYGGLPMRVLSCAAAPRPTRSCCERLGWSSMRPLRSGLATRHPGRSGSHTNQPEGRPT